MSTWIYLHCLDHDPVIRADCESGQHLHNLKELREDVANRDALISAARLDAWPDDRYRRNTVQFLTRHPKCRLTVIDEYDTEHALRDPEIPEGVELHPASLSQALLDAATRRSIAYLAPAGEPDVTQRIEIDAVYVDEVMRAVREHDESPTAPTGDPS